VVRPLFAGLRLNHHPQNNYWLFYISWRLLSSNSAPEVRMLLLWIMFVPGFVSPAAKLPEMRKVYCSWLGMACTRVKSVDWWKRVGSSSGSGVFYAWSAATR
jgi:hypothetical protein